MKSGQPHLISTEANLSGERLIIVSLPLSEIAPFNSSISLDYSFLIPRHTSQKLGPAIESIRRDSLHHNMSQHKIYVWYTNGATDFSNTIIAMASADGTIHTPRCKGTSPATLIHRG